MNINYDWYKVFYKVAIKSNITLASQELFISQPAVSQCIKQLEKRLACNLFIRSKKGVELTKEGKVLFDSISKGIEQFEQGEKNIKNLLDLDGGEIHIGASDMTLEYYLLPYLETFHLKYPNIKISITNGPTPVTIDLLDKGEIDFAVVSEPIKSIADHDLIKVRKIEDIFICGKDFKEKASNIKRISDLKSFPLILLESNTSTRKHIDEYFKQNGIEVDPEFELATSSLIVQFTKRNLGIGCVVKDFALSDLKSKEVFEINFDSKISKRNICIIKNKFTVSKSSDKLLSLLLT